MVEWCCIVEWFICWMVLNDRIDWSGICNSIVECLPASSLASLTWLIELCRGLTLTLTWRAVVSHRHWFLAVPSQSLDFQTVLVRDLIDVRYAKTSTCSVAYFVHVIAVCRQSALRLMTSCLEDIPHVRMYSMVVTWSMCQHLLHRTLCHKHQESRSLSRSICQRHFITFLYMTTPIAAYN